MKRKKQQKRENRRYAPPCTTGRTQLNMQTRCVFKTQHAANANAACCDDRFVQIWTKRLSLFFFFLRLVEGKVHRVLHFLVEQSKVEYILDV